MQRWPLRHAVFDRRRDFDDRVLLHVQRQRAADAAVGADGIRLRLLRFVPLASRAQLVLGGEHQRAGRADADAVAAVDAGRVGQRDVVLGGDVRVEAATGDGDREGVLRVRRRRPRRTCSRGCISRSRARRGRCRLDRLWRPLRAAGRSAMRVGAVCVRSSAARRARSRDRPTSRETPAPSCGCGARAPNRCGSSCPAPRARAGRHEHARAFELDDADAAGVDGRERFAESRASASRCRRALQRVENRRAGRRRSTVDVRRSFSVRRAHLERSAKDAEVSARRLDRARRPSGRGRRSRRRASRRADVAHAKQRLTCAASPAPLPDERCRRGRARTGRTTRRGRTRAMRAAIATRFASIVEEHDDARAERRTGRARVFEGQAASRARRAEERARRAAEQDRLRIRPSPHAAGQLDQRAERRAVRHFVDPRLLDRAGQAEEPRAGRVCACRCARRPRHPRADERQVHERLDVVDRASACRRGRPAPETAVCCAARRACLRSS